MFELKQCSVLSWGQSGNFYGITIKLQNDRLEILNAVSVKSSLDHTFAENIKRLYEELAPNPNFPIILTGYIAKSLYAELPVPNLPAPEIDRLLTFELGNRVPFPTEELLWCHRLVPSASEDDAQMTARTYLLPKEIWNELLSDLGLTGIKYDYFVPALFGLDPIASHEAFYLPDLYPSTLVSPCVNGKRNFTKKDSVEFEGTHSLDSELPADYKSFKDNFETTNPMSYVLDEVEYFPALLAAIFQLKYKSKVQHETALLMPHEIRPQRLRSVKNLLLIILILAATSFIFAGVRIFLGNNLRMSKIKEEIETIESRISKINRKKTSNSELLEKIAKLQESERGDHNLINHLIFLTESTPMSLQMKSLSLRGTTLDLTFETNKYNESDLRSLQKNKNFRLKSQRKRVLRGGKTTVYITLEINKESADGN